MVYPRQTGSHLVNPPCESRKHKGATHWHKCALIQQLQAALPQLLARKRGALPQLMPRPAYSSPSPVTSSCFASGSRARSGRTWAARTWPLRITGPCLHSSRRTCRSACPPCCRLYGDVFPQHAMLSENINNSDCAFSYHEGLSCDSPLSS